MKKLLPIPVLKLMLCFTLSLASFGLFAQSWEPGPRTDSQFWEKVQFGGVLGVSFGSGYSDIVVAPGAIYNFNQYFAAGPSLHGSYVRVKNDYESYIYGGSLIGLFNPIEQIQVSLEVEQLRVNSTIQYLDGEYHNDFWNTGLFVGLGYRAENITIGARYNLLFDKDKTVYSEAFMPFVRVYF